MRCSAGGGSSRRISPIPPPGQNVGELINRADVLIEGFRPGTLERLGLGPDACCAADPGLIYARMTGWGQDGPASHVAGHDINYLSVTGALNAMGRPRRRLRCH